MAFYNKEINDLLQEFNSSIEGLALKQVEINRSTFGSNYPKPHKKNSFLKRFFLQFKNLMIIILIVSAIISLTLSVLNNDMENLFEAILIFAIVIVNAIVGVIQEQKAESALQTLQNKTIPYCKIIRNGKQEKIKIHDIVVGDIIHLKSGDYIPADIRIISSTNLRCNESPLTGESHEISKSDKTLKTRNLPISAQTNICFAGTNVVNGKAVGIVCAVGQNTEFGKIENLLSAPEREKTPLEKNIDKIGKAISLAVLLITVIVFIVQICFNKNIQFIDALLISVTLAVAAIPESLPAIITIIMALGVQRLAKQNAIVKKLSSVETLGCCNIICTDKTGTLTENKMSTDCVFTQGQLYQTSTFSTAQHQMLTDIFAVCNSVDPITKAGGDASEKAIIEFLNTKNVDFASIKQTYKLLKENEFNSRKKTMSVLVSKNNNSILMVKGAIDYILPKCTFVFENNTAIPLTDHLKQDILNANDNVCERGERVIACAFKLSDNPADESNLCFAGFIGIADPPRKDVASVIESNKKAGIKTVMITGDHPTTAFAIAKQLGISHSKSEVLTGKDIDNLSTAELCKIINNYSVFARVSPENKYKIVDTLKRNGNIVAMTGDGVNDAPSIKHANIGLSMGITGTDVTKEVADIIISDDNYSTVSNAICQGRTIYHNISKTILFLISTNLVEVLGIFITSLLLPNSTFLLPTQILFINLVTDSLPAFALGLEKPEKDIMSKAPRNTNHSLLSGVIGSSIIYQGFIQTLVVLVMFVFASYKFDNNIATTMSFMTICLMQIIHAVNCKSEKSIFKINIFQNTFFNLSFIVLLGLILLVYFVPALAALFSLTTLSLFQWSLIIFTSLMIIPMVELGKIFIRK